MKLVTGNTVETNVEAVDDRAYNAGIVGIEDYVFNVGRKFDHEIINNNTIRIYDGEGVIQGSHFITPYGAYDDVNIDTGTTGYNRIDLICVKYSKLQNTELAEFAVIKGVETTGMPQVPDVITGNILQGASEHNMALKKVTLQGTNILSIDDEFKTVKSMTEKPKLLWSGAEPMTANCTITLAEKVSEQKTGIELVFAPYKDGKIQALDWWHSFVSKGFVAQHPFQGSSFFMAYGSFDEVSKKFLRIDDSKIMGDDHNVNKGTRSGITFDNTRYVLAEVWGV